MMKKGILLVVIIALIFSGCSNDKHHFKSTTLDIETVKEKLIINTEYVKENIVGTWSASDGTVMEFHPNGIAVNYKPVQMTETMEDDDISSIITSELKSIGYSGYVIPDPDSYTDEELQSYGNYIQSTDKVGVSIKSDFFGTMEDKFILHEFKDKDTLVVGGLTLTKIKNNVPEVTDDITGLYVNEQDKTLALSVIRVKNENVGYFDWQKTGEGLDGECETDNDRVVLKIHNITNFVFQHKGVDLIEVGSNEIPGSNLTYKKVSDLAYSSQRTVAPRENGYLLTTTEFDNNWKNAKVGDTIMFGSYKQDNNFSNGPEPIEWIVINKNGASLLLISKFAIECHDYYTTSSSLTWKDSEIRNWLNNGFYYEAFSLDEQTTIQNTKLFTNRIHESGTSTTEDKVFLLSQNEAETYFSNSESRKCEPTIYMKKTIPPGLDEDPESTTVYWYLRSSASDQWCEAYVNYDGDIDYIPCEADCFIEIYVRPALWIDLDS